MREFTTGASAIVRGALAAGCDFFAGYPITPATPILLEMMREMPKTGGVAVQGEDEIASIGMCIGAAAAGRLPLTATSGPGLSLYSENLGLALMAETPLVIVDVQRLGPATGGATTVGQGDVQFARWGTGGGYPLLVLAPSSVAECYTLTVEAFALAQRFRCPVILLTDKELNLTQTTVEFPPLPERPAAESVLPVAPPFGAGEVVRVTGSTHDERGLITKDPVKIEALNRGLLEKFAAHREELERVRMDLQPDAETLWVSFGITARAMEEALPHARAAGQAVSCMVVQSLWPVPEKALRQAAEGVKRIVVAELNPGLYVREIQRLFPGHEIVSLHRIDGQLLAPADFLKAGE
ncbi:MAG TPA: pyruvate flavodoxin/ferredoxin oxidoreductase [Chloroflexi bacterium]|nr:pyruvate flavodoxin/ferredoxin oxidoreductase [Chloroflexota bacterium]